MGKEDESHVCPGLETKCPECKQPLRIPRIGVDQDKPLICGGCGRRFDCNDLNSVQAG